MNQPTKSDRNFTAFLWVVLGILGRLIPHPPNMAPMTSIALFGGCQMKRSHAFAVTTLTMIVSDILLALAEGHAPFGMWSLFTYSGFAAIVLVGMFLRTIPTAGRTLGALVGSTLFFWLWTNFGIWLVGDGAPYAHDAAGLVACYAAALPFLGNALVGDLAWGLALFASFSYVRKTAPRFGVNVVGA